MKIEVTSNPSNVTISGVTKPVIGQRTVEQVIQLKEGSRVSWPGCSRWMSLMGNLEHLVLARYLS
ncbi:MAG: ral secretion pathway protein [Edaphobacter sp.]|nr:ral secretion pathway protein [Edaphobacter sp.]